jgi:peptide deformylase
MALRTIVTVPEPVLRKKARKVTDFGPDLQKLIDDMVETMRAAPGVGLAAPQVGVPMRVIVVEYGDEEIEDAPLKLYTLVNPEIARASETLVSGTEGCLSIPGYVGEVERLENITIKGLNRHGKPIRIKADDWLARVFQHEIDHLDGILFTDRAKQIYEVDEAVGQAEPQG